MSETVSPTPTKSARWQASRIAIGVAAAILAFNATVAAPVAFALSQDERDAGVVMVAYRSWAVSPVGLTVDLVNVDGEKAPADVFRALLQAAASVKDRHFGSVTLARRGIPVFSMDGDDFQEIGRAYQDGENPLYLIRTLPEHLKRTDGSPAFLPHEGGVLYVLSADMEDVNAFARTWLTGKSGEGPDV